MKLGHAEPPDPDAPGMFSLSAEGRLAELLRDAGFTEVEVVPVSVARHYATIGQLVEETENCLRASVPASGS